MFRDRMLTRKQEESLDRIAKRDPKAIVVGWDGNMRSPIILFSVSDYQLAQGINRTYKVINPVTGYARNYYTES